jgi:large subunit ribosomal protein L3
VSGAKQMVNRIPVKKIGMSSAFDGAGTTLPVTLVQPFDVVVTQIKRPETHGYAAIQLAFGLTLPKRVNKCHQGLLNKAGVQETFRYLYETKVDPEQLAEFEVGQVYKPGEFLPLWNSVKVTGKSKGKGFAGAMKRWGFSGQMRTHGDPDNRRPMSNNATDPARVFKGSRRPGRMGATQITLKGVSVFEYDAELNLLALNGSVPGPNGGTLFLTMIDQRAPEAAVEEG